MLYRNAAQPHPIEAHRIDSLAMFYTSIGDGKEGVRAFLEKRAPQFKSQRATRSAAVLRRVDAGARVSETIDQIKIGRRKAGLGCGNLELLSWRYRHEPTPTLGTNPTRVPFPPKTPRP